jgi:adenosine kinase
MSNKRVLISGSIAYDNIMVFEGYFKDHILPDKVHMLNVGFLTPGLRREFGGTAANIGLNLHMLGGEPVVMSTVGAEDGAGYIQRLKDKGVNTANILTVPNAFTAQAFITTDLGANQITAFHPGAMNQAHEVKVATAGVAALGLISPNGRDAMIEHAVQMKAAHVPYIFDPGQGLPMFGAPELNQFIDHAHAVTVNDYEAQMLSDKTNQSLEHIAAKVTALIVTLGADGADIYTGGKKIRVAPAKITKALDPTGCGDAFRAGLVFGRVHGWDWTASVQLGNVMGATKIECLGAQNHTLTRASALARYALNYGTAPNIA